MIQKIEDTIINVIPLWRQNFSITIATYRLNNAVTIQRMVNEATNKLLVSNSEVLKNTLLQTAEEMGRSTIDPESIKVVYENTAETFISLAKVSDEQKEVREKAIKTMDSIQAMSFKINSGAHIKDLPM